MLRTSLPIGALPPAPVSEVRVVPAPVSDVRVDFPVEFWAWLEYLEHADPHAFRLFQQAAAMDNA